MSSPAHNTGDRFGGEHFADRHIGVSSIDTAAMLQVLGVGSIDALLEETVPASIRLTTSLDLGAARTEVEVINELRDIASSNTLVRSMIGQGYYGTITPPVILRNVLESPAWYTAYTPYQPEISQGRLEALLNFQTMVADLTGMDLASASLLDEATAAAEAMMLARRTSRSKSMAFLVDAACHPQVIDVVRTRAEPLGIELIVGAPTTDALALVASGNGVFGTLLSWPGSTGALTDHTAVIDAVHAADGVVCVATDLLACVLVEPPGARGADVVVGSAQRFGVPLGFGGPHAGFMAVRDAHKRSLPGRLVGVSVDAQGRTAMRLALQTREQHIRREKATSNICTAQVLLAVMSGMYACWHGPDGLRRIARRVQECANEVAAMVHATKGLTLVHDSWFDTVCVAADSGADPLVAGFLAKGLNVRRVDHNTIAISCDETTTDADLDAVARALGADRVTSPAEGIPVQTRRTGDILSHGVFRRYRSETDMLRYLRLLADKDLALDRTMIPLGSCTMKLNATTEMIPVTWREFSDMHPFAPIDQTLGYRRLISELEAMLVEITGYDAVSLQPNAGSQGEFAGLLAIRNYHLSQADHDRTVCLIPSSAHGTNAASAAMCGMRVVVVDCDPNGNVDLDDLRSKINEHRNALSALMITYPSTHGVFEEDIVQICELVHEGGGQVYVDGANLNALVGVAKPGSFGADVSHLNLHKTFCIPHGGGGPGVGPVCVRSHLAEFLPGHPAVSGTTSLASHAAGTSVGALTSAPFGSAGILPIPWAYIAMMGADGLRAATATAILSANYIAHRLDPHFPVLYRGRLGRVAHECILDLRAITERTGITVDDVAKRLIDYGFHAPTMSFPVAGTLMVEPTESESLHEIDRFCDAMIAIRNEIERVAIGEWPTHDNPLCNAPHPAEEVMRDTWSHPYARELAAYPLASIRSHKYWPPVSRIDGAYGDRNVMCSCPPIDTYS